MILLEKTYFIHNQQFKISQNVQ